jgi:glycosyltransferase involved in cell wall biosynthesis
MKLSVIIPCYNAAKTIAVQLEALAKQQCSEPWEVIIADNGSTDESMGIVERFRQRLPNLRMVDASAKPGQPYALNIGAQAAKGESLAFCDADDEVGPGWLAAMVKALSKFDFVACRFETKKLNSLMFHREHAQEKDLMVASYPPYLPHAGGGSLGVKRSLHKVIGGFDEALLCVHDTDFCFRLQMHGTKLHFVPEAVTHIRSRDSFRGLYRQARDYSEYKILMLKKLRSLGVPKLSWKQLLVSWLSMGKQLIKYLLKIRHKREVTEVVWQLGACVGRLRGCIKYRFFV